MTLSLILSVRDDPIGALITVVGAMKAFHGYDYEIVVVENSKGVSREMLRGLIHKEYYKENVVWVPHPESCLFSARQEGVTVAKGDYLVFLDSHMLLGYGAVDAFVHFLDKASTEDGFVYGPLCYHNRHEMYAYHDRDPDTFFGLVFSSPKTLPINFRGVPFGCKKEHWNRIKGYGFLAQHYFDWGGGDIYLGLKSLMLGYKNWLVPEFLGIHFGPYKKPDPYFRRSYMRDRESSRYHPWYGWLGVAYVCGGLQLLNKRQGQISKRVGGEPMSDKELEDLLLIVKEDKDWLDKEKKFTYEEICAKGITKNVDVRASNGPISKGQLCKRRTTLASPVSAGCKRSSSAR